MLTIDALHLLIIKSNIQDPLKIYVLYYYYKNIPHLTLSKKFRNENCT